MHNSYFLPTLRLTLKNKKNLLVMMATILFAACFVFIVKAEKIQDGTQRWENYRQSLNTNTDYFDTLQLRQNKYRKTYNNLSQQAALLAQIQNGEVLDEPMAFTNSNRELLQIMIKGYDNNYKGAPTLAVPPKYELRQQLAVYDYLADHRQSAVMTATKSSTYLIYLLSIGGIFIYILTLTLACDVWEPEMGHRTLLQNVPLRISQKLNAKFTSLALIFTVTLIISALLS